jgi:hypothetical protein
MASGPNSRNLTVILAIGGVVIALFAAYSLFKGGGGSSPSTLAPSSTQTADSDGPHGGDQTIPSTPSTTSPGQPNLPNGQFDVFATRNPFEPAVEVTPADTGTDTGSTTGGTSTPPDTAAAAGTDTTTTVPASANPSAGTTVAVIDVFQQGASTAAVVQVGSTQYTVVAGQVFATSYKVVSLSGTCGQFMFGDSPFSLCEGEQVIK